MSRIALRTKPLPWCARHVGPGTIIEFVILAVFHTCVSLFSKSRTDAEILLGYSGTIYCVHTADKFAFVASDEQTTEGDLTDVLRCYPVSDLISCDSDYPRTTEVKFQFESRECITLHFVGSTIELIYR